MMRQNLEGELKQNGNPPKHILSERSQSRFDNPLRALNLARRFVTDIFVVPRFARTKKRLNLRAH